MTAIQEQLLVDGSRDSSTITKISVSFRFDAEFISKLHLFSKYAVLIIAARTINVSKILWWISFSNCWYFVHLGTEWNFWKKWDKNKIWITLYHAYWCIHYERSRNRQLGGLALALQPTKWAKFPKSIL